MIRGAILDIDGTLLDSMGIWLDVGARYLKTLGIEAKSDLGQKIFYMSMEEGAAFMKKEYSLTQSEQEIRDGVTEVISDFYRYEVKLKPGAAELVKSLKEQGIPMILATTGSPELADAALRREGIRDDFQALLTATEMGTSKHEPLMYLTAAEMMGCKPGETAVYEDMLHAVTTAAKAGFHVVAVKDFASAGDWEQISQLADEVLDLG